MTGDDRDARLQRCQHRGLLAHRTVLAAERPDDDGVGARGCEPLAARAPRHRADTAGITGHAHVPVVGEPPAVQCRLVHRSHQKLVVGTEGDGVMRAGPGQEFGRSFHVGKPQGHAVVMRDREPQAFRREGKPADGRGHVERFLLGLAALDGRGLAGRPGEGAVGVQRHRVDPAPLRVGGEQRHLALGVERDDLAVVAAHDEALAVEGGGENAAAVHGDLGDLTLGVDQGDVLLAADEGGAVAQEVRRGHGHAERNGLDAVGDGDDRGGIGRRRELFHHETMQLSKPLRMASSGNSRPMKTRRLSRGSPSFHFRWWLPSSIMWTPWKT